MKLFRNSLYLASILFVSGLANAQSTDTAYELHIPAQPLQKALSSLADQTGLQVVYESSLVTGRVSPSVDGTLTPKEALAKLLEGTGLHVQALSDRAIAITDGKATPAEQTKGDASPAGPKEEGPAGKGAESDPAGTETVTDFNALVVTGTHIRGVGETGSPVQIMSREDIDRTGYMTVQEVLSAVTSNTGGGPSDEVQNGLEQGTNFNAGSSVNLRGLGASSTLVLVNGHRQAAGGIDGRFTDLSSIPATAIDRIEILTDGASAVYGSDAVGGVVNVILRTDYEGVEATARYGDAKGGGDEHLLGLLYGKAWENGNFVLSYQNSRRKALAASERAYTADSDKRPLGGSNFSRVSSNPGNIYDPDTFEPVYGIPRGQDGTNLTPGDLIPGQVNYQNFWEGFEILPDQSSNILFTSATYKPSDALTLAMDARYSERNMRRMSFAVGFPIVVPNTNPFFVDPFGGSDYIFVGYNFHDDLARLGGRKTKADTDTLSTTLSALYEFGNKWTLDSSVSYGKEKISFVTPGLVDDVALDAALADTNPATAFNPFGDGSFTNLDTLRTIFFIGTEKAATRTWTANMTAQGPIMALPGGDLMVATGIDYRDEWSDRRSLTNAWDGALVDDDNPNANSRKVSAVFFEMKAPLFSKANARTGLQQLTLSLAGRAEDYSDFGRTFNPKVGLSWYPVDSLQVRGSYGTSFRAPNLTDMDEDTPLVRTVSQLVVVPDPTSPTGTSKVIAMYGNNSDLKEETAKTWTVGMDFKPINLPGLEISTTYYDIKYEDRIARGGPATGVFDIFAEEDRWSPIITRNPDISVLQAICSSPHYNGSQIDCLTGDRPTLVDLRVRNLGMTHIRGLDLSAAYTADAEFGFWGTSLNLSRFFTYEQSTTRTSPSYSLLDTFNNPIKYRLRASMFAEIHGLMPSVSVNYQPSYTDNHSTPSRPISSYTTVDARIAYRFGDRQSPKAPEVALSATNLFDRDAPFVDSIFGYDQINADPVGRVISLQLTKEW